MDRRVFLKSVTFGAGFAASSLAPRLLAAGQNQGAPGPATPSSGPSSANFNTPRETRRGGMLYRALGRTGEQVSAIGLGGSHIGQQSDPQLSLRIIRSAIDSGITFMDNCWDYHDGESEVRMGKALRDGYRDKVFLMTKVDGRTKETARRQLEDSLKRLQTDHLDLWQFHEVIRMEDPDRLFGDNGAINVAIQAQKEGKIRFIGFTGHKDPRIHLQMLEMARKHNFHFDTVQMPLNVMDASFRSFQRQVMPVLLREEIGVLGMKSMGSGIILQSGVVKPVQCLSYALSLPTAVVITGIDSMEVLKQDLDLLRDFKALSHTEMASLEERATQAAATGEYEKFKTDNIFDGTAHHPEWLG